MPFKIFEDCYTFCSLSPAIYREKKLCPQSLNVLLHLKINNKCMEKKKTKNKKKEKKNGYLHTFCNGKF